VRRREIKRERYRERHSGRERDRGRDRRGERKRACASERERRPVAEHLIFSVEVINS